MGMEHYICPDCNTEVTIYAAGRIDGARCDSCDGQMKDKSRLRPDGENDGGGMA